MPISGFCQRCPNCYSVEHSAYRLILNFGQSRLDSPDTLLDLGAPYGDSFRHCEACGLKFSLTSSVELIELKPTTPRNEQRSRIIQTLVARDDCSINFDSYPEDIIYV